MAALHARAKILLLAAAVTLLAACSGDDPAPAITEPPATTTAPTTSAPATTLLPATTTVAPTTTTAATPTTTLPVADGPPPPVSATITDPENPDIDEVTAVVEELWAHYQWWLAHPEEPLDSFIADTGHARDIFEQLQNELVATGVTMQNGLTVLEVLQPEWSDIGEMMALWVAARRDDPRVLVDVASGDIVEIEAEASDETRYKSWTIARQPDQTYRISIWSVALDEDLH